MFASLGSGRIALEQRAATFPGVSEPSSVVRSMQRMASSSAKTFASFLIDRFASDAEQGAGEEQARPVRRIPLEATKPGQPKKPRHDPDANAERRARLGIEGVPAEPLLRSSERVTLRRVHEPTL